MTQPREPLAIIGAACRLPGGVGDLPGLWRLLAEGKDAVTELPEDRCSLDRFFSKAADMPGHGYTRAAGVLSRIKEFDPEFFGFSRKEATDLDPQQRLILELAWEAMENAGVLPSSLRGSRTGVYVGASGMDFSMRGVADPGVLTAYSMIGSSLSIIANRVSYAFDLRGPSLTVDTACSSSMVALHMACEALRRKECSQALVGGVNVLLSPLPFIGFSRAHMLSPAGRCKVFDASADGYVRAEGAGAILIKPLSQARKDKDTVLALIAGTGVNSDGRTTGLALPNKKAQMALLREVYERFDLDLDHLAYVEAHGTGTAAGDPIEASAVGEVLGKPLQGKRPLLVGSVKSNIGHLEPASGMAGLLKVLLVLQKGVIPPNLHFSTPNPAIDFKALNLAVPTRATRLPLRGKEALVSVNSFGFGGTNAHAVLQKAPPARRPAGAPSGKPLPPLLLSAASEKSLRARALSLAEHLEGADAARCRDTALTLALCRDHLRCRAVVEAVRPEQLPRQLKKLASDAPPKAVPIAAGVGENCRGAFAFSGNGCQWAGMGRALLAESVPFAAAVEEVDALLRPLREPLGAAPIIEMLRSSEKHAGVLGRTENAQPLLFAVQVGLVRALTEKGITPDAVFGHSVGEVAAAWACGALDLKDACTVVHFRSLLQAPLRGTGQMAVTSMAEAEARELLAPYDGRVEITAVNAARALTLAGDTDAVADFLQKCKKLRVTAKMLDLPYPFHTRRMEDLKEDLLGALRDIRPREARIPFLSTALPEAKNTLLDAGYWWNNLRNPVQFALAGQKALELGCRIFLEIGPHRVLGGYLQETVKASGLTAAVLGTLYKNGPDAERLESSWKEAWQRGWAFRPRETGPFTRQNLPPYPWNREYLWSPDSPECRDFLGKERVHPLLGWRLPLAAPVFENVLSLPDFPWLRDHKAGESTVFPAAGVIETMLAAAEVLHPGEALELERLTLLRPLRFASDGGQSTRMFLDKEDGALRLEGRAYMSPEEWSPYASARAVPFTHAPPPPSPLVREPEQFGAPVDSSSLYATAERFMLHYGPAFRMVEKAWLRRGDEGPEALARLTAPDLASAKGMRVPPTLIDGAFHTLLPLLRSLRDKVQGQAYLPAAFGRVVLYAPGTPAFALSRLRKVGPRSVVADFDLLSDRGTLLLSLSQCRFRRAAWLENESAAPAHYVMRPMAAPRADAAAPSPLRAGLEEIHHDARAAVARHTPEDAARHEVHPRMLLRFAALTYAHEAIAALAGATPALAGFTCADLMATGRLAPRREPWLRAMLHRLAQAEMAREEDGVWELLPAGNRPDARALWRTVIGNAPGCLPEASLLSRVMSRLPELFADDGGAELSAADQALFTEYFTNSQALQPFTHGLGHCVRALLRACSPGDRPRILQFAADPRKPAGQFLPLFAGSGCRYDVAVEDAAQAASLHAAFAGASEVRAVHLDLGAPLPDQLGGYDLIIAAFALHRQPGIAAALEACRDLLAPGGILCLLEHQADTFTDLTLGSDPGWWAEGPTEGSGAPASRLYRRETWQTALKEAGFQECLDVRSPQADLTPGFLLLARKAETPELPAAARSLAQPVYADSAENAADQEAPLFLIVARQERGAGQGLPQGLARELKAAGHDVRLLRAGDALPIDFARGAVKDDLAFDPLSVEHWGAVFLSAGSRPLEIVSLLGYDTEPEPSPAEFSRLLHMGPGAATALARAWEARRPKAALRLVTGGAQPAGVAASAPVPSQGAVWGFGRVLMNEMPGLRTTLLDLHGTAPDVVAAARELHTPCEDHEIILAGGARFTLRLAPLSENGVKKPKAETGTRLTFDTPGRLQNLYWQAETPAEPGPGKVRIAVKAVGLNFRDVMWSLGMLPDEALENGFSGPGMGIECSGVVECVGEGVSDLAPGDAVMAFAPACFSTHVVTAAAAVFRKPEHLGFAEAATVPVAFMTAWYSIKHLANMQPGERILIHGAAGGVGLAALQVAALLGLEVHATAGAPEKHAFLRGLGVRHLYSSRSLNFAPQVMTATQGQGVDAVLNSLSGEAIAAGISVLRPFGRFLELGKRDFFVDSPLRLHPFSRNLSFFGIDVDQLLSSRVGPTLNLLRELMEKFDKRQFRPLPFTCYPRVRTVEAFQAMQQSGHIGKLVVLMDDKKNGVRPLPKAKALWEPRKNASYLITGGTGGFGFAAARRLARRGARRLILLSRSGVCDPQSAAIIEEMRAAGTEIVVAKADVGNSRALECALKAPLAGASPLAGVIHAAAVLDDGMIQSLSQERLEKVLDAKALGAWNLHHATKGLPLDFFVLYSSVAAAFGNPGQANYVAANCTLETLAAYRKTQNLPATVIGWGPVADTGMLQRNAKLQGQIKNMLGVGALSSHTALSRLEHCLIHGVDQGYYFSMDWQRQSGLPMLASPRFEMLVSHRNAKTGTEMPPLERVLACSPEEGLQMLAEILQKEVAELLCLPEGRPALDSSIASEGMDSLLAMELGLAVDQKFSLDGFTIPLSENTSVLDLAKTLYPVILSRNNGGDGPEAGDDALHLIDSFSRRHGAGLSDSMKKELRAALEDTSHDR